MQIGPRHKVACHFAGEFGASPSTPVTLSALGVNASGNAIPGVAPDPNVDVPEFSPTFVPLAERAASSLPLADR